MLDKVQKLNTLKSTKGLLIRPFITLQACCLEVIKYQVTWQECNLTKTEKLSRRLYEPPPSMLPSSLPTCTTNTLVTTPSHCLAGYCQNQ